MAQIIEKPMNFTESVREDAWKMKLKIKIKTNAWKLKPKKYIYAWLYKLKEFRIIEK